MKNDKKIRYAVIGLGSIAQGSILPAFRNAKNAELAALVSDDPRKLEELGKDYKIDRRLSYDDYDQLVRSGDIDAVYIALPNNLHADFTDRAARGGVHVLCEKPMAVTEDECERMIAVCRENRVKLMIAYRLHFEPGNLEAIRLATSGDLGDIRLFTSTFTQQVRAGDIRLRKETGGGTIYDIGVYCINAARYIFRDEPIEVSCSLASSQQERFREAEEMSSCLLRFPGDRIASFACSFGAAAVDEYTVVGTKGSVLMNPAYSYDEPIKMQLKIGDKQHVHEYSKGDQFGPEISYFADRILNNKEVEPSGEEGLADVRIIRALYRSAEMGRPVTLPPFHRDRRPTDSQAMHKKPVDHPDYVDTQEPTFQP